jgi:sugar O-acyltransferase (sialic acid O-acetyltransferase NeuD family)
MENAMTLYAIFGAGGFRREVMPAAREMITATHGTRGNEFVFVEENLKKQTVINGYKVISEKDFLSYPVEDKYFNIAVADYKTREYIADKLLAANIKPFTIQASNAVIYDDNHIGEGAILCAFTTITSNVKIGRFFHANIYSYVAHDSIIGNFVTFAPSVHCNGRVVVEDYAYIGTGVVIKEGRNGRPIVIGKGSIVGMGAVVTKNVPPFTTVIGNPAVEMRKKS